MIPIDIPPSIDIPPFIEINDPPPLRDILPNLFGYTFPLRGESFNPNPSFYLKSRSLELFLAVAANNVSRIENYLKAHNDGVNDLDVFKRNALQSARDYTNLRIESCNALIQFGINLNNEDSDGNTLLGSFVNYYNPTSPPRKTYFPLFRCIVEGGADLNVKYKARFGENVLIREKIRSTPELEAIVQDVNSVRANHVYAALGGDFCITKLVCEILDLSPASNWRPTINR